MFLGHQTASRSPGRMSLTSELLIVYVLCGMLCVGASAQTKPAVDSWESDYQYGIAALQRGDLNAARSIIICAR